MTEKKLKQLENKCYNYSNKLLFALDELSQVVSKILGYKVNAEICNGEEIEFRIIDDFDNIDAFSTIRMEDVIEQIKNN